MKQKPIFSSTILHLLSVFALVVMSLQWTSQIAWGQTAAPQPQIQSSSETDRVANTADHSEGTARVPLKKALTRFALQATRDFKPDTRNGLIRVAVLTARGSSLDLATRQALATELALIISEQPNILILEPSTEREVMGRFDQLGLELSDNRSISLGQHLGVRYVMKLFVESAKGGDTLLKTETVSVKRRGSIKSSENEALVSSEEIKALQKRSIFYESKLEATWRSALIPGWGQLYQGKTGAAIAYMSLSAGLLIGGLSATLAGDDAAALYRENTSDKVYYRQLANSHYARARLLWGGLSITWLSATLSAYLQGEDRAHVKFDLDPQRGTFNLSGVF